MTAEELKAKRLELAKTIMSLGKETEEINNDSVEAQLISSAEVNDKLQAELEALREYKIERDKITDEVANE